MAIIACPECGKKISSHAPICSHCGFQKGEISEEQLAVFQARKLRDRIYHLNMISYAVITAFVAAFGWYWWDSGGFEHQSSAGPFILMGLAAVAYLFVRVLLFRKRQQQKALRKKEFMRSKFRQKL
jgi:membrane protein YdbS with pleckstrin-like domain